MGTQGWAVRSFLICFILNGILMGFIVASPNILGGPATPAVIAAAGGIETLILWLLIFSVGRSLPRQPREKSAPAPAPAPVAAAPPTRPSPEPAIQVLAALQREGRLIDFLQEDISSYDDAQIGAAVRNIHTGCRTALQENMEIRPVFREQEGTVVTVPPGFDVRAIRLTGNVAGNPPFKGTLRHRGWQAERIRLPGAEEKNSWVLAPAEVEIE